MNEVNPLRQHRLHPLQTLVLSLLLVVLLGFLL